MFWIKILEIRVFIRAAARCFIAALPTPLLSLIKILSLRKAHLTPLKSKFRRCTNSFNKIHPPFLPIVSIKILSPLLQVVCDQNSIIADLIQNFVTGTSSLPPILRL
ncbi:hypothetical protein [Campylobacter sp.]|uniref:hypothetical protein n=1 Tax=Campylobacter sp. TaxID=205 RepID=UPI0027BA6314|nr:hypothetical protein [Campylobacter sp.]